MRETKTYDVELTDNAIKPLRSSGRFSVGLVAKCGENTRMGRLQFVMPIVVRPTPSTLFLRSEGSADPRIVELSSAVPFELVDVRDSARILETQRKSEGQSQRHRLAVALKNNMDSLADDEGGSIRRTDLTIATQRNSDERVVIPVYILGSKKTPDVATPN